MAIRVVGKITVRVFVDVRPRLKKLSSLGTSQIAIMESHITTCQYQQGYQIKTGSDEELHDYRVVFRLVPGEFHGLAIHGKNVK